jgi:dTDP-4-amino-4,6-dideoxygalactose transaminase
MSDVPARPIPFIDLQAQRARLGARLERAIGTVLEHGQYILGPEVGTLEAKLAAFAGAGHAIACANGTDALALALMAKGIGPGDAVLVPAFTFVATAEAVALMGATPVFCDVREDTFNLDPDHLETGLETARTQGLTPRAVIPVDLFGQPADYERIEAFCAAHDLWLLADAAQSFGATYRGRRTGSIGLLAATSFFPAKPLGCYGDGGAVFTADGGLANALRSLRVHGQGRDKYDNVRIGMNGRLDTLQAAIMLEKLDIFEDEILSRQRVAARYGEMLADLVQVPEVAAGVTSVWAQYTIQVDRVVRDRLVRALAAAGIPTALYYPIPLHRQKAYRHFPAPAGGLPVAERLAGRVLSLPMHPYLDEPTQTRIAMAVRAGLNGR